MTGQGRLLISASRRTDIPAFYMQWFMACIAAGSFRVENPYSRKASVVPAAPERVHGIVFWSKNFGPFLEGGYGPRLKAAGYGLFFNFTVNSADPRLEPAVPPLEARLEQMAELCRIAGPLAVNWRFDPICFYRTAQGEAGDNLEAFAAIADQAAACGIRRCVTSFLDLYAKVRRRAAARGGLAFIDPTPPEKAALLTRMAARLGGTGIALQTCCEKEALAALPPQSPVAAGACIPGGVLAELFGPGLSLRSDAGQRVRQGCGCAVSVDIGSYRRHPCFHDCLFCYANPRSRE